MRRRQEKALLTSHGYRVRWMYVCNKCCNKQAITLNQRRNDDFLLNVFTWIVQWSLAEVFFDKCWRNAISHLCITLANRKCKYSNGPAVKLVHLLGSKQRNDQNFSSVFGFPKCLDSAKRTSSLILNVRTSHLKVCGIYIWWCMFWSSGSR